MYSHKGKQDSCFKIKDFKKYFVRKLHNILHRKKSSYKIANM